MDKYGREVNVIDEQYIEEGYPKMVHICRPLDLPANYYVCIQIGTDKIRLSCV